MKKRIEFLSKMKDEQGVTVIMVAVMMTAFIGLAALAVDLGHLYLVRNELQNAADAGALAGARFLYNNEGTGVNPDANQIAYDGAIANKSEKVAVEVQWEGGNSGDVERGHWRFSDRTFTANDSTVAVRLDRTFEELDADPDFINAVRVRTRRQATPVASFFARIFGHQNFLLSTEAVAYIGFAGTLGPSDVDQPIAICKQAITDSDGKLTCGVGRMINSGSNAGHQTGGWTNFSQEPCSTASSSSVRPLVCGGGNPGPISPQEGMGTTGGELQAVFNDFYSCWKNAGLDKNGDGWPEEPWSMKLVVIDCPGNNTGNCSTVLGTVTLNVVWITQTDKSQMKDVPRKMLKSNGELWECPLPTSGATCWQSFADAFGLQDVLNGTSAIYEDKTIYFLPSCEAQEPTGTTGGYDFGVLAKIPVLVN